MGKARFMASGLFLPMFLFLELTLGQDEQWLRYRTAEQSGLAPMARFRSVSLEGQRPDGVRLPRLSSGALFGRWVTPLTDTGFRWFAIDRTKTRGFYDLLYIDSNGDGHLDDEQPVKGLVGSEASRFGAVKVTLKGERGPVTYHLVILVVVNRRGQHGCYVVPGCWYEGTIDVDGAKVPCTLVDYTANGTFSDRAVDPATGRVDPDRADRIIVGRSEDGARPVTIGSLVEINGWFYQLEVARDGAYVRLDRPKELRLGKIRVPKEIATITILGLNGHFHLRPRGEVCEVPVGTYRLYGWQLDRTAQDGKQWAAEASFVAGPSPQIEVTQAEEVTLGIGEPFVSKLTVTKMAGDIRIWHVITGHMGEQITLVAGRQVAPPPRLRIWNQQHTYGQVLNFAYG